MAALRRDGALSAIITYKFVRAAGAVMTALTVLMLWLMGITVQAEHFMQAVQHDAADDVSLTLSNLALVVLAPEHLLLVLVVLLIDATLLFLQGWALQRGWNGAPWLVVAASGLLLPFELAAVLEKVSVLRVGVLGLNLVIISYLLVRTWRRTSRAPTLLVS